MNTVIKTKPVLVQIGYLQKLNTTVARILFGGNVAVGKSKKDKRIVVRAAPSLSRTSPPKKEAKEEVTTSSPKATLSTFQPIARTPEISEDKERPFKKAFESLIIPISIVLSVVWLALFSFLQVASLDNSVKNSLTDWFLRILIIQILFFMAAIVPTTVSYFTREFSPKITKILTKFSYGSLVLCLVSAPAPLAATLGTVRNNPDIYTIYLIFACVVIFFLVMPAFTPKRSKA